MKSLMRSSILLLTTGLLALVLFGCSDSDGGSSGSISANLTNRLYVAAAESGTLTPTEKGSEFILTLNQVWTDVKWFSDRPEREIGENTTTDYVGYLWPLIYGDVAPNAVIKFHVAGANAGLFVALGKPEYDPETGILKFKVTLLNYTFDEHPQGFLEFDTPVVTVLNNVPGQDGASDFVVYGEDAFIDVTSTENRYTLIQEELDNSVLLANNAPGRYSNVSTTEEFVAQWNGRFGDSPPNAVIFGIADTGELYGYLLTLTDPKYDEDLNRITYSATVLGQETEIPGTLASATLVIDSGTGIGIPAIEAKGNKLYYSNSKSADGKYKRFIPRGVAYQPVDNTDPISDDKFDTINNKLIPMLRDLNVNSIRVYQVDASLTHDKVMELLADNNIYVLVGLADGLGCAVDRSNPQWTSSLYGCMSKKIDTFQKYDNVLAFSAGNEVWEAGADTYGIASALKAAVRDMKSYIKSKQYRQIPVGIVSRDDPQTTYPNIQYSACQYGAITDDNPDNSADFIGYNMERWNSPDNSFHAYDTFINFITENQFNIPAIFTECGVPYTEYYPNRGQSVRDWSQMKYIGTDAQFPATPSTNNIFPNISGAFAFRLLNRNDGSHWGLNDSNDYSLTSHIPLGGYDHLKSEYADASKEQYTEIPPAATTQRPSCPSGYGAPKPTPVPPTGETITITVKLNSSPQDTSLNTAVNYVDSSGATKNAFIEHMLAGDSKTITIPKESTSLIPGWITGNSFDGWYNICGDTNPAIALTGQSGTANVTWNSCSFSPD